MTDDPRARIAAVQREHRLGRSVVPGHDPGYICECGWRSDEPDCTWTDHPEHVADAVISELGLTEFRVDHPVAERWWATKVEPIDA